MLAQICFATFAAKRGTSFSAHWSPVVTKALKIATCLHPRRPIPLVKLYNESVLEVTLNSLKVWMNLSLLARKNPWHLVCDVDGVLTDGKFGYSEQGKVHKTFGSHDAEALKGSSFFSSVSFITADERGFEISARRVRDMGHNVSLVSSRERADFIRSIKLDSKVAFIGDSFSDIPAMRVADLSAAPRNAYPSARRAANIRLTLNGGEGAVAELVHLLEKFLVLKKEHRDL